MIEGTITGNSIYAEFANDTTANPAKDKVHTVGERLDARIAQVHKQLEELCVAKAKAEAVQMLNTPMDFIEKLNYL